LLRYEGEEFKVVLPGKYGGRELEGGGLYIKRAFKDVVAQFIGQLRLMNQATTEVWG